MVSIIDVAKAAGVSKSTVSLVINASPLVQAKTRKRVERAIDLLGYQPNFSARKLKGGANRTLGVIIPNIENPFFSELLQGIEESTAPYDYTALIASSHDDQEIEQRLMGRLIARGCDAILVTPSQHDGKFYNDFAARNKLPVILLSRCPAGSHLDAVLPDNADGAYELGRHIAALDRPVWSVVFHQSGNTTSMVRLEYLRKALADLAHREIEENRLYPVKEFTRGAGRAIGKKIAEDFAAFKKPIALFAQNDMVAIGLIQELTAAGIRIPEEVAVFGFDGLDFLRLGVMDISSICISALEMGRTAGRIAVEKMTHKLPAKEPELIYIPVHYLPGQTG